MTTDFRARNIFNILFEISHLSVSFVFYFCITCSNCYSAANFLMLTDVENCVRNTAHVDLLKLSYGEALGDKVPCTVMQYHAH